MACETETVVLRAQGEVAQVLAEEWRNQLLEALKNGRAAVADLSEATAIGLPVFQLLLSAHRSFRAQHLGFEIRDPAAAWSRAAASAGLSRQIEA